jgi:preprotein translocase subunit SecG
MINLIVLILDIISAMFLVIFVLLHSGKGGGLSGMFGGGDTMVGGTAIERRLDKITVFTAILFAVCTSFLAWRTSTGDF